MLITNNNEPYDFNLYMKAQKESSNDLDDCNTMKDIFDLVRQSVKDLLGESRAGLDIELREMGNKPGSLVSAFYPVGSNVIVLNVTPLKRIMETDPKIFRPYLFSILLHEYLHSLGYLDENEVRRMSCAICAEAFGSNHITTRISIDTQSFFNYLLYPGGHPATNKMKLIEVEEIDYIG